MKKYTFSVFTPCFNSANLLHRVYDSLLAQDIDHNSFEWIVINDASDDDTDKLLQKYIAKADFSIKCINNSVNKMVIRNYKMAIDAAEGAFFLIIGHDDKITSNCLSLLNKVIKVDLKNEMSNYIGIMFRCRTQKEEFIGKPFLKEKVALDFYEYYKTNGKDSSEKQWLFNTNELKKYFQLPKDDFDYIPESYFWNEIFYKSKKNVYCIDEVLRVYHVADDCSNLSYNIRNKYPKGFEFYALSFLNSYRPMLLANFKLYFLYIVKYVIFSRINKRSFSEALLNIRFFEVKVLFCVLYLPSICYAKFYLKKG